MEKQLVLELKNHNVYYVKTDLLNYYITIPKIDKDTNICIELKSKMDNYNLDTNDSIWVMENIKNVYSYIDPYNITLILPIFKEEEVNVLEKMATSEFEMLDKTFGSLINSAYMILVNENIKVDKDVIMIKNDRYNVFINWFTSRYHDRIKGVSLLELIRYYNVNATPYRKLETSAITYVVGSYNQEVDAPKIEVEPTLEKQPELQPQYSSGFTSYWLLAILTLVISAVVIFIVFMMK